MSDDRERVRPQDAEGVVPRTEEGADFEGHGRRVGDKVDEVIEAEGGDESDFEGHRLRPGG